MVSMTKAKKTKGQVPKAQVNRIKGNGDYKVVVDKLDKMMKAVPKGTFAAMGGALAGLPGAAIGAGISSITGYGDYKIGKSQASAKRPVSSNSLTRYSGPVEVIPSFGMTETVRVRHREFVASIAVPATPSAFTNRLYRINPGNANTFPWLASFANSYQQYRIKGMVAEYVTNCADFASQFAMGTVTLCTNYNVQDPPFTNAVQCETSSFSVTSKPSMNILHALECDPNSMSYKQYYTAANGTPINPINDFAMLQVVTEGLTATAGAIMGRLYISYDIELTKPVFNTASSRVDAVYNNWPVSLGLPLGQNTSTTGLVLGLNANASLNSNKIAYSAIDVTDDTVLLISDDGNPTNAKNQIRIYRPGILRIDFSAMGTGISNLVPSGLSRLTELARVANETTTMGSWTSTYRASADVSRTTSALLQLDWSVSPSVVIQSSQVVQISFEPDA